MDVTAQILSEFTQKTKLLEDFKNKLDSVLFELLESKSIDPHQITCRVKNHENLKGKIERKGDKYTCLNDITDIVGLRIITYFEDDVDVIAEIVRNEFEIDEPNSVDKRKLETDCFGYQSLHYVVSLNNDRAKLSENKKYVGLKAEIQIRSVLQHAWAEIEHDLGYKGEIEIPVTARRGFSRIAALLETADIEFVRLKTALKKYEEGIKNKMNKEPDGILIDKASIKTFIISSPLIAKTETAIAAAFGRTVGDEKNLEKDIANTINGCLLMLNYLKIKSISELINLMSQHTTNIVQYGKAFISVYDHNSICVHKGGSIIYLCYYLIAKEENEEGCISNCRYAANA